MSTPYPDYRDYPDFGVSLPSHEPHVTFVGSTTIDGKRAQVHVQMTPELLADSSNLLGSMIGEQFDKLVAQS